MLLGHNECLTPTNILIMCKYEESEKVCLQLELESQMLFAKLS